MAVFDALLARLPILRRQQVGMVLHEMLADTGIAQQEAAELFGKHIVLADGYHGSADISSSSVRACGMTRNWQSVTYSISS